MQNYNLLIKRYSKGKKQTIGRLYVLDENDASQYECHTLELPWINNLRNISCIAEGEYEVEKRTSPKFGEHFHITNVEGRSWILIHIGNFYTDIRGCIIVGTDLSDIDDNGIVDVKNSGDAMKDLLELMPKHFTLKIV